MDDGGGGRSGLDFFRFLGLLCAAGSMAEPRLPSSPVASGTMAEACGGAMEDGHSDTHAGNVSKENEWARRSVVRIHGRRWLYSTRPHAVVDESVKEKKKKSISITVDALECDG